MLVALVTQEIFTASPNFAALCVRSWNRAKECLWRGVFNLVQ